MKTSSPFRKTFLFEILPFCFGILADRNLKDWATGLMEPLTFGAFVFEPHFNHGVVLGLFSDLPQMMRLVTLSSVGALVFCTFLFFRFFIPLQSQVLKSGMSLLCCGIMGNVIDRLVSDGGVVDFIGLVFENYRSPIWNVADVIQLVSYVFLGFGLWYESKTWMKNDLRRTIWVNIPFQKKFTLTLVMIGFGVGLVTSVMSFAFLKSTLQESDIVGKYTENFIVVAAITQLALMIILFLVGSYFSSRIAGPLFAMKRFMTLTLEGKQSQFKLRSNDEFREFESPLNQINDKLNSSQDDTATKPGKLKDAA